MYTTRRKPKCHTCGNFMAGHKRVQGVISCPPTYDAQSTATAENCLISPPPSPEREPGSSSAATTSAGSSDAPKHSPRPLQRYSSPSTEAIKLTRLPGGGWHRRNPNWNEGSAYDISTVPTPPPFQRACAVDDAKWRELSPSASLVSTVLVDDTGRSIRNEQSAASLATESSFNGQVDWDDTSSTSSLDSADSDEPIAPIHSRHAAYSKYEDPDYHYPRHSEQSWISKIAEGARENRSAVTVFRAQPRELEKIERTAMKHGVYARTIKPPLNRSNSRAMVVLGRSASFVSQIANTGLPWNKSDDDEDPRDDYAYSSPQRKAWNQRQHSASTLARHLQAPKPHPMPFLHLVFASIIGGVVVICAMAYFPSSPPVPPHVL